MIRKNRTMDAMKTMASAITHDFNNILTTISYSIELAMGDIPENSLTYEDLDRVLKTSLEAGQYIREIMSFCKPAKSGVTTFDILPFAQEAVARIQKRIPEGTDFQCELPVESHTAKADPEQLNEIFDHVIDNCVQSLAPSRGRIELKISYDRMPGQETDSETCLKMSISDTGSGIPKDIMPFIFDPFFSTKAKDAHKGLGLSIVYSLVENHEGLIMVSSQAFTQTVIHIYLPVVNPHDE